MEDQPNYSAEGQKPTSESSSLRSASVNKVKIANIGEGQNSQNKAEQAHYQQLEKDRLESAAKMSENRQQFSQTAKQEAKKYENLSAKERVSQAGKNLAATRQAYGALRNKKVSEREDEDETKNTGMWFMIFMVSILGDILTLMPLVGSLFSIPISATIWFIYAINGYFGRNMGAKLATQAVTSCAELLPMVDALPIFTLSAVLNYRLLARKNNIKI